MWLTNVKEWTGCTLGGPYQAGRRPGLMVKVHNAALHQSSLMTGAQKLSQCQFWDELNCVCLWERENGFVDI